MITAKTAKAENIKQAVQNKIFKITFVKRDGSIRHMNCRFGVRKYLKHGKNVNDPSKYLTVFDMQKKGYRNVRLFTIQEIRFKGSYKF